MKTLMTFDKLKNIDEVTNFKGYYSMLPTEQKSEIIELAWQDHITFDDIEVQYGLLEKDVIALMRSELKASSFKMWRKRVTGRASKHKKLS